MGGCKYFTTVILFLVLAFTATGCTLIASIIVSFIPPHKEKFQMVITSITLTENSMIIECERRGVSNSFDDKFTVGYKNIPRGRYFDVQIEDDRHWKVTLTVDLTDIPRTVYNEEDELRNKHRINRNVLYVNEEATFFFKMEGAHLSADVFIEEEKIDILDQRFYYTD